MSIIKGDLRVHIRWLIRRDMPAVLSIENASFDFPWTDDDFRAVLRQRNCIGMVAEYRDHVLGFMVYELHTTSLELLNFAVAPDARRHGVGHGLATYLRRKLTERRRRITLVCRETNLAGHLFWKAEGFQATRIIANAFPDTDEDGYMFVTRFQDMEMIR